MDRCRRLPTTRVITATHTTTAAYRGSSRARFEADERWRVALSEGTLVDALDTHNKWFNATVVGARAAAGAAASSSSSSAASGDGGALDPARREVQVGFRVYTAAGDKQDARGGRFLGWSARWDEWLSAASPRVQPLHSRVEPAASWVNPDAANDVDDAADPATLLQVVEMTCHVRIAAVNN